MPFTSPAFVGFFVYRHLGLSVLTFTLLDDYKLWQPYKKGKIKGLPKYPKMMPPQPQNWYKKEETWTSWNDFLGYDIIGFRNGKKITFEEAKAFVQKVDLK